MRLRVLYSNEADTYLSAKMSVVQTKAVAVLNDSNYFFNQLAQRSGKQINVAFVLECSDLLKTHVKHLGKNVVSLRLVRVDPNGIRRF